MDPRVAFPLNVTRRHFLGRAGVGIGVAALAELLQSDLFAQTEAESATGGLPGVPHFAPKAKRVIYLFQGGGPSQLDLFDYKPQLETTHGTDLPDSIRMGQRLTGMTAGQTSFPVARSIFPFAQYGKSGAWVSELLPYTAQTVNAAQNFPIQNHETPLLEETPNEIQLETPGDPLSAVINLESGREGLQILHSFFYIQRTIEDNIGLVSLEEPLAGGRGDFGCQASAGSGIRKLSTLCAGRPV